MGDTNQKNQDTLRAQARDRVERGALPRSKAIRTWGGRGSGLPCSLCDSTILPTEPEMELEFEPADGNAVLRFHLQCQSAWEAARRVPAVEIWTPIRRALPPYDALVEARLSMGEDRKIILTVILTQDRNGDLWLNGVTHQPLPENWRPLEWRPAAQAAPAPAEHPVSAAPQHVPKKSA